MYVSTYTNYKIKNKNVLDTFGPAGHAQVHITGVAVAIAGAGRTGPGPTLYDGPVVVIGVPGLKEDLLARDHQDGPDIFAKHLDAGEVGIEPVALDQVQEVHQGVVLAVVIALTYPNADIVVLSQGLPALHDPESLIT